MTHLSGTSHDTSGVSQRRIRPARTLLLIAFLCLLLPQASWAFERDSHYYLRFALSLATCFDWNEAHIIASGDWGMDENLSTHAEMNPVQSHNKTHWHAFGHSDARFRELWLRSLREPDLELRLVKLGQFMHFLEDWESHAGYGIRLGHARDTFAGRDPDSLGNDYSKNHRMVQSALDHLLATCKDLERLGDDRDLYLVRIMKLLYSDGLMDNLYEASDPNWKRGKLGGLRPEGESIRSVNKERIETFIETNLRGLPENGVPDTFAPGGDNGIPLSLQLPFDQDGRISDLRSPLEAVREMARDQAAPDILLSLDSATPFYRGGRNDRRSGWDISLHAENLGQSPSEPGSVEVMVVDSDDETLLAQASEVLPALDSGETRSIEMRLSSRKRPEADVIIGAFARVDDGTAMNDEDWLMLGDAELETPDVATVTDLDPALVGHPEVNFVENPKYFIIDGSACLMVTAVVSGGDSTEKLEQVVFEVIGEGAEDYLFQQVIPGRWSAMSTEQGLIAGKTFQCYEPEKDTRQFLTRLQPDQISVSVTLEARGMAPRIEQFPVDAAFVEDIKALVPGSDPP